MRLLRNKGPLSIADAKRFYDGFGARQDKQAFYEDPAVKQMIEHAAFPDAHAVLEIGCGTGRIAKQLLSFHLPQNARYLGLDVSETMTQLAQSRVARYGERARMVLSDGTAEWGRLVEEGAFDRVVSTYVFDLLPESLIDAYIAASHRALEVGGRLCLVSLTHGEGMLERLVERLWMGVWKRSPSRLGGCRPVALRERLPADTWSVLHHSRRSSFGLCSEILVASKIGL